MSFDLSVRGHAGLWSSLPLQSRGLTLNALIVRCVICTTAAMTSAREASSRHYLDELDLQAAVRHFRQAAHEAETGGDRLGDIARRELHDEWETMNGLMESRPWPGGGRARHAADFTEVGRMLFTLRPEPDRAVHSGMA